MIEQLLNNGLCWAILLLALLCYQQLWMDYLNRRGRGQTFEEDNLRQDDDNHKREFTGVLIGALPLMGLLGTIIGLLDCFAGIATEGASSDLVSGGIANALLTTQLGLVCAIPGWLLQTWVKASARNVATTAFADAR